MSDCNDISRRKFLKTSLGAMAAVPVAALVGGGTAFAAEQLKEDDPQAQAMHYRHDVADVSHDNYEDGQNCANCSLYAGDADADWAPCSIFGNKEVNGNGWCTAYNAA
ncbi:MAG: high-potential iron-sulfur protein [Pseudomonadota bacterium]